MKGNKNKIANSAIVLELDGKPLRKLVDYRFFMIVCKPSLMCP